MLPSPMKAPTQDRLARYRPPRIAAFLFLAAAALHWLTPVERFEIFSSTRLSIALVSIGLATMLWAWWQFKKRATAICPTEHTDQLVTDGIYRITRNPMYLGIVLMMSGAATFFGTLPFYAAAVLYFAIVDGIFRRYEERKLAAAFGHEYQHYKSSVRPWI